jgi:tRNA-dihydrouridine synthase 1
VSASWIVDICGVNVQNSLFEGTIPDPVSVSLEYLELCRVYPGTATLKTIQTHTRHFMENQWWVTSSMDSALSVMFCSERRPWFSKFRTELEQCASLDEIEALLRVKVRRWRGLTDLSVAQGRVEAIDEDTDILYHPKGFDLTGFLDDDELHDSNSVLELDK